MGVGAGWLVHGIINFFTANYVSLPFGFQKVWIGFIFVPNKKNNGAFQIDPGNVFSRVLMPSCWRLWRNFCFYCSFIFRNKTPILFCFLPQPSSAPFLSPCLLHHGWKTIFDNIKQRLKLPLFVTLKV